MNLYPFARAATYPLVRALFKISYEGLENIPEQGGYILACNHRTNFDPLFIAHKIPSPIAYLAKIELVKHPLAGPIIKSLGVVPIDRGSGDTGALESAALRIGEGSVLGMFPEGTRSKDGVPLRPRSGVAIIAGKTGTDILPCAVVFGKKLGFREAVTVRYGPVIPNSRLGIDLSSPSAIREASRLIMEEILALAY